MAFDYLGAKQDGYTDEEIAAHLASSSGFDLEGAVTDGYTYSEISQHLSGVPSQREAVDDPSARDSTIGEEFERGLSRLGIDYSAFVSSFSNPEEAATEAIRKGEEVSTRLGRPATLGDTIKAYEEEGVIGAGGEVLRAIPRVTAQQLPTTATVMAGTTGAAALMPVPQLKPLAGYLGGFTALYPQLYAQNIQRQAEVDIAEGRDVDINRTKAAVAAVGQTAAEQLATYFTLGKGLVSRLLGRTPKPRGVRSSSVLVNLAQDSLKGVARGAAVEIPTEISQQIIERAQAGLDVMSDEAYAEYGEAAYMAGIAGGTIGGVSGAATPIFTPTQTPPEDLPGDLPTTPDLSEITPETITPDLPEAEPTTDIAGEDAVSRLKNLGEAYDEDARRTRFQEQLEVIAPNLRGVLKGRGLDDIGINIAYSIDPQVLGRMRDPQEVEALFDADTRTIFLGADRIRGFDQLDTPQLQQEFSGLVNHEMVHAVKRMKLWTDAEWAVLENAARRQINADGLTYLEAAQTSYSPESVAIQNEEAVAELIRDTLAGRTGLAGQPLNLMQRLIEFFRKMGNALTGTGYASFNQVVNDIDSGVLGGRTRGGREAVSRLDNLGRATPVATPMIVGSPALASRKKVGYLPSADPLTIALSEMRSAPSRKMEFDGTDPLSTFFAKKAAEQAGYNSVAEYEAAAKLEQEAYEKYADDPLAVREALVKGENPFGEKDEYKLREEALALIDKKILDFTALRDPKYYKSLREIMVGTKRRPEPFQGVYENVLSTEMTKDEFIEEFDEMFNLGSTQERATRQGLSVVPPDDQTPLASRQALGRDRSPMGINVRQDPDGTDYASLIASGQKTYESRESRSLDPYVGKRVDLVRTGAGPAAVVGSAEVGTPIEVDETQFANMRGDHLVAEGSAFDIKRGKTKFLYPMTNAESTEPTVLPSEYRGIVARKTGEPLASRRLKSDVQAQQQLPLPEGMTGAEVAAEELRVAEQEQRQEQARTGVAEARRILEDDQQPLASRRQKTAKGADALGAVPRPPRDAGWEQRAREQGFDTGRVLYHYTDRFEFGGKEFERFIPSAAGKLGPGVYTSPDADYAERYILRGPSTGGARAIPVFARGRIANEEDYQQALELAIDDYRTRTTDAVNAYTVKKLAKEILEEQGFSGIERQYNKGKEVVIFDPKNLRSIHANFDPAWTESTTLLASRRRLDRAKEQGFDTDTVYYHGTGKVFDEFDTQIGRGARTGTGTFLSVNPTVASTYASDARDDQANILPAYVRLKNPITVYADGNNWSRLGPDIQVDVPQRVIDQTQDGDLLEELGFDRGSDTRTEPMGTYTLRELFPNALLDSENMDTNDIARWARQQQGVDGIIFEDIRDLGPWRPGIQRGVDREAFLREINAPTRNVLVFDAKNIRSVNAEFDSDQTESPRLLASRKLKTKPEDSAALAEDKSKGATEVRGNPEADRAAADEVRKVKTLASRRKPSDIVESTAYNRVADVASTRASRGQGNINNALPFEAPSSADDRGFVYQVQDKYIDLKKAIERVIKSRRKQGLTPLLETENPYLGEESMHGIIGSKFNRFEQDEIKPLVDKLTGRNITRQELEEFLVLRHAIERNAHVRKLNAASKSPRADLQDGGAGSLNGQRLLDDYVKQQMQSKYGMTWNDSNKSWEGGNRKAAIMNDLANDFDAITRGTLQELKDSGLINQDSLNKLQGYYKYYAPLRGVSPDEDVAIEEHARISKSSNNLSIKGVETEKAKGRVSEASPPLGQIIFQRQNAIRRGTINDVVGQRMLNVIRENPNDDYWKIHTDRKYADVTGTELLGVKEDGKQFFIEFKDPRLREAMLSLDGVQSGKIVGMLRYVNRILSAVNTSLNPEFMFGNFFRDLGTAMGNVVGEQTMVDGKAIDTKGLKRAIIADTVPSIRQVYRGLRGKKLSGKLAQDWKEYLESGAKTEWFYVKSPEESATSVDHLIEMSQGTFKGNVRSGKKAVASLIEDLNGGVENGVRFAVFKKARDAFIKNGLSRELAVAKAATLSKNLTVNFNRMGNRGELLNGLYLFFNASVQGTANFLRGMSSPAKQRMLLAMVSFGALMTRMNELSSEEDEDLGESYYSQIEPWVKERNLVVMKSMIPGYDGPPEEYYTIPLPYGYNVLHVLGVNIAENMMGIESVQDSAGELVAASLGSFMPVGFGTSENPLTFLGKGLTPQIGKPFVEIAVNENFFGAPVYTENFDFGPNIPAAYRAKQSTPEIFKNTTRFLNELTQGNESMGGEIIDMGWISPDVLDHFFNTITGGLGATVERSGKAIGAGRDYLQGNYVEGDITLNDIPFVRRAMREVTGRESQSQYYDRRDDIYAYDRQLNLLRGADRGAFVRENRPRLLMKRVMDSSDKRLRNINRRLATIRDSILTSSSMENTIRLEEEEKRLQDLKQSTYDRFNKLFNERVGRTE